MATPMGTASSRATAVVTRVPTIKVSAPKILWVGSHVPVHKRDSPEWAKAPLEEL